MIDEIGEKENIDMSFGKIDEEASAIRLLTCLNYKEEG